MNKRTCEQCRFWHRAKPTDQNGQCRRYPPSVIMTHGLVRPTMAGDNYCGEWRDQSITPEQEQRAELVERFAVAIVQAESDTGAELVWRWAEGYVDARPKIGGES